MGATGGRAVEQGEQGISRGGRTGHRVRTVVGAVGATVLAGLIGVASFGAGLAATTSLGPHVRDEIHVEARADAPAPTPRPVVVLYGDSLSWEAQNHFVAAFASRPDVKVVTHTFGGTAICDFLNLMRADALTLQPGAVVVEFSGNAFTGCMMDAVGEPLAGAAYEERYRSDAEAVVGIFGPMGAHVYFAGAPIGRPDAAQHYNGGKLNGLYEQIASAHPDVAEFVDAGAAVLDHGRWTATLPCMPGEPCPGAFDGSGALVVPVRAPDGAHFCPVVRPAKAGVTGSCGVWSGGAYRYGLAMAAPVLRSLDARAR